MEVKYQMFQKNVEMYLKYTVEILSLLGLMVLKWS